jgi:hypothetical protein
MVTETLRTFVYRSWLNTVFLAIYPTNLR